MAPIFPVTVLPPAKFNVLFPPATELIIFPPAAIVTCAAVPLKSISEITLF
ncbi:hypothetical protein [Candidatus Rickettsia colombianensi]|uniref:hypothetical protein n=1 Tax=Candidatus Rickettsia colombianensi TaxID=1090944 RepID=UPI0015AA05BB|nr:hypothetical protein [Candidatus Rickettsia colombianensi]